MFITFKLNNFEFLLNLLILSLKLKNKFFFTTILGNIILRIISLVP